MTLPPQSPRFRLTDFFVRTAPPGRHADGDCLYLYVKCWRPRRSDHFLTLVDGPG